MGCKEIIDVKNGSKNIWHLGVSSFFNDVGSEMITPILPFYILALGGGGVAIGLLSGLREGFSSLFKLFGGWASDKSGKRMPLVFLGYVMSIIFKFLIGIANSWQQLIAFISLERFGKLRDAPRDAIISVSTKRKGRGFGIHQMLDSAGGVFGTLIVLFLFWRLGVDFKTIIFIAAGVSFLSLVPLFFVKEHKAKPNKKNVFEGVKSLDNRLKYFVFVTAIFTFANFGAYMFLLLRARDVTGSMFLPFVFYILFNLVYTLFSVPAGSLSDKIGRKKVLFGGYFLFLIVSFGFIYSSGIFSLLALFVVYGLVYAIVQPTQRAFVSDLSGDMKGTALGFYYMVLGLVSIPAGIIAGVLWNVSYQVMFGYLFVVAVLAIVLLGFVKEEGRR